MCFCRVPPLVALVTDDPFPNPPSILTVALRGPINRHLLAAGKCSIRIKIKDDKTTMERRRFRIKIEAIDRLDIEPALTDKLTVM